MGPNSVRNVEVGHGGYDLGRFSLLVKKENVGDGKVVVEFPTKDGGVGHKQLEAILTTRDGWQKFAGGAGSKADSADLQAMARQGVKFELIRSDGTAEELATGHIESRYIR